MKIAEARAVITGGASGLGNAVARHLAASGGQVTLLDVQEGPGRAAADAIGTRASFVKCDVTAEAEVVSAMEAAAERMGGINLLVNCAGVIGAARVLGRNGPMAGEFFTKVIHINLIGTFLCDKAAAALMQKNTPNEDGDVWHPLHGHRAGNLSHADDRVPAKGAPGLARQADPLPGAPR
jgi:NAD(P)-dependent dehydrogenase (short-subunit alcohol dehydrogenase family)